MYLKNKKNYDIFEIIKYDFELLIILNKNIYKA